LEGFEWFVFTDRGGCLLLSWMGQHCNRQGQVGKVYSCVPAQQPATARLEIKKNLPANANENRAGILCRVDVFS